LVVSPVVVVGAGLAGLVAAADLTAAGQPVMVLEQGPLVGGRLATASWGGGRLDMGAQFFTVRSKEFAAVAADWLEGGAACEWCRGFAQPPDGYPRYAGRLGMVSLADQLAAGLDVRCGLAVSAVRPGGTGWTVDVSGGMAVPASAVILTAPVPESVALLDQPVTALDGVAYEPTLAVGVLLDGASAVPPPGGVQLSDGPFSFEADNQAKGISSRPAVTLHASGALSAERWDDPSVLADLVGEGRRWFGKASVVDARLVRWPYARPVVLYPSRCLTWGTLVFAGDAFGEARVEGAVLSGQAAAAAVLDLVAS
jgi:predicted NAD/FAD-dependent oxidoreductase